MSATPRQRAKERLHQMRYITERSMCSRQFEADEGNEIWAYFWAPYQRDEREFICDYMVIGLNSLIASYNIGVDGLDAVMGATDQVRVMLSGSELARNKQLHWWGYTEDFGLYNSTLKLPPEFRERYGIS